MTTNYDQPLGGIDKETLRYLSLTKVYPRRHFCCDSCGVEYQSATFYTLAYHESELPYARVYCEKCLSQTPTGQKRCQLEIKKNMNKKKIKPTKKVKKKTTNLPTKPKLTKSTHDYYCCCAEKTKQGIPKGTKITQLTQHCKNNAGQVVLAKQKARETEKKKILEH